MDEREGTTDGRTDARMRQTPSRRAVAGGAGRGLAGRAHHTVTRSMQMIESISGTGPIIPSASTCQEWLSYLVGPSGSHPKAVYSTSTTTTTGPRGTERNGTEKITTMMGGKERKGEGVGWDSSVYPTFQKTKKMKRNESNRIETYASICKYMDSFVWVRSPPLPPSLSARSCRGSGSGRLCLSLERGRRFASD